MRAIIEAGQVFGRTSIPICCLLFEVTQKIKYLLLGSASKRLILAVKHKVIPYVKSRHFFNRRKIRTHDTTNRGSTLKDLTAPSTKYPYMSFSSEITRAFAFNIQQLSSKCNQLLNPQIVYKQQLQGCCKTKRFSSNICIDCV